jgi:hypothetical protein
LNDDSFEIYPNPSPDKVFVKINANTLHNMRLIIIDAEGREIFQYRITDQPLIEIYRNSIQSGTYYFQLWNENNLISTRKAVLL